mmetsp:Transcript_81537/g.113303  ORF Transcript_81537/g.113303 Transcript_81537/m.113303 type:complete len:225 (+) Transcript_81537:113-787(+)
MSESQFSSTSPFLLEVYLAIFCWRAGTHSETSSSAPPCGLSGHAEQTGSLLVWSCPAAGVPQPSAGLAGPPRSRSVLRQLGHGGRELWHSLARHPERCLRVVWPRHEARPCCRRGTGSSAVRRDDFGAWRPPDQKGPAEGFHLRRPRGCRHLVCVLVLWGREPCTSDSAARHQAPVCMLQRLLRSGSPAPEHCRAPSPAPGSEAVLPPPASTDQLLPSLPEVPV